MAKHDKKRKSGFSIRYKMILGIGIPLILVLSVIGTVLRGQIVSTVETLKEAEIELQTKTAREEINGFFGPFFVGAAQIADIGNLQIDFSKSFHSIPPAVFVIISNIHQMRWGGKRQKSEKYIQFSNLLRISII